MSSAFVKEGDYQHLRDVAPNVTALLQYLRRESGAPVHEIRLSFSEKHGRDVYEMSDGLSYSLNEDHQWEVILD